MHKNVITLFQSAKRLRNIRGLFLFFTDIMTELPLPVHASLSAVCENNKERGNRNTI